MLFLNTLVIEDNNPNMLPMIAVILAVLFIIYCAVSVMLKVNKKKRLEETQRQITKTHRELEEAQKKDGDIEW